MERDMKEKRSRPRASDHGAQLGHAFAHVTEYQGADGLLRDAISTFVADGKRNGEPIEHVIVSLKAIAHRATIQSTRQPDSDAALKAERVVARAVTMCIERFYDSG
jgi:hypothetical protein